VAKTRRGSCRSVVGLALLAGGTLATTVGVAFAEGTIPAAIPARSLELHTSELPGFKRATKKLEVFESADQFLESRGGSPAEVETERALLTKRGWQGAVGEFFRAPHREAIFVAFVFSSPQGATEEFNETLAADIKHLKGHGAKRSTVKGIPGSVLVGQFERGHRGGTGNVLFATGRCLFVVGDALKRATSRQQAYHAPITAARAILRRQKHACA